MAPLEKCMQTLNTLIEADDINGIANAEGAINEFVSNYSGRNGQIVALRNLEESILSHLEGAISPGFVVVVLSYIDSRILALGEIQ